MFYNIYFAAKLQKIQLLKLCQTANLLPIRSKLRLNIVNYFINLAETANHSFFRHMPVLKTQRPFPGKKRSLYWFDRLEMYLPEGSVVRGVSDEPAYHILDFGLWFPAAVAPYFLSFLEKDIVWMGINVIASADFLIGGGIDGNEVCFVAQCSGCCLDNRSHFGASWTCGILEKDENRFGSAEGLGEAAFDACHSGSPFS